MPKFSYIVLNVLVGFELGTYVYVFIGIALSLQAHFVQIRGGLISLPL